MPTPMKLLTCQGESMRQVDWARRFGIANGTLSTRIDRMGVERALSVGPAMRRGDPRWRKPVFSAEALARMMADRSRKMQPEELVGCPCCSLRGDHECLWGDARAGMGQWAGAAWGRL